MSTTETSNILESYRPRPPKVDFSAVNPNNLGTLRKLNQVLFPIKYSEKFYKDVLLPQHESYCQLIYYNDIPVGCICCRIEADPQSQGEERLYMMTMGVLAPYRSMKAGTKAVQLIVDNARSHNKTQRESPPQTTPSKSATKSSAAPLPPTPPPKPLSSIYMHVQTSNMEARRFYERNGFKEVGIAEGYYKKLEPHDAWILELSLAGE